MKLEGVDAVILCGGLGTRLRSLAPDKPKVLMPFGDRTFLDILMESLSVAGITRVVLSVGYLKEQIISRYEKTPGIVFAEETSPLGTGGALKNAAKCIKSKSVLVMNGDSIFTGLDLSTFHEFHAKQKGDISIALAKPRTEKDFGVVTLTDDGRILNFAEKTDPGERGLMNGGVYFIQTHILDSIPDGPSSIEHDLFPRFAGKSLYGFFSTGEVIDIGTPERYEHAKTVLARP